jgi:CBS domain-containing protein
MKVKDVMIREVKSLSSDTTAKEALGLLEEMQISGLPVIDKDGKLVGMFTEKDILAFVLPSYLQKVGKFIYEEEPKAIKKKFSELSNIKVSQLMRKEVVTAGEEVNLGEVARVMLTQKARRIPVVDKSGKVVGIIARCDVLKAMVKANV